MVKLICFPYVGSSSFAYARWRERSPARIDVLAVELLERGRLHAKLLQTPMADLLQLLRRELTFDYQRPFALCHRNAVSDHDPRRDPRSPQVSVGSVRSRPGAFGARACHERDLTCPCPSR